MGRGGSCPTVRRDESGAVLVLALVFLVVGSLIAVALGTEATTIVSNSSNLRTFRTINYAADGAVDGAIEQVRYHGACESFPKAGSLQLTSNEYVYVQCANTPVPVITALETNGSTQLTSPSSGTFSTAYATSLQPVTDSNGNILGHITSVSSNGATATVSFTANVSGTVYVGEEGERFDTFTACASSGSAPSSCSHPELTVSVLFGDIRPGATPTPPVGDTATVETWVVSDANA